MIDVAIVGAGAAGLAAARRLRRHGLDTVILEAGRQPGGRARTTRPAILRGAWLDEGAAWLHAPDRNPLVSLAHASGAALRDAFTGRSRRLFVGDHPATGADEQAYEAAEAAWREVILAHAGPDVSLAEAANPIRIDPWVANVETWEATIIAAADPDLLGVRDWRTNELPGGDLMPEQGGMGTLTTGLLTQDAGQISLDTEVTRIDRRPAGHLDIHTGTGIVSARHVIVTVSTGVLRAERIRFTPPLPATTMDAIARLPMGLLSRLVLAALPDTDDRLDFAPGEQGLIERRLTRPGEPTMHFGAWPHGEPHLVGFHGGRFAWSVAVDHDAANDFARRELAASYGESRIARLLAPGFHATDWGTDPHFLGAYAYAGPGDFPARAALAEPIDGTRLLFAGEATQSTGLAGTLGGAVHAGEHAAGLILDARETKVHAARVTG